MTSRDDSLLLELKLQRICAWSGPISVVLQGISFCGIARLFPPLSPTLTPDQLAEFFTQYKIWVRFGALTGMLSISFLLPFLAVLVLRTRRAEGHFGMLSLVQAMAATSIIPAVAAPQMILAAVAYRPEHRAPEITQALNDLFWLWFVGFVGPFMLVWICLAIAAFTDRTATPMFPRWYGYLCLWSALLSLPGCFVLIFNEGPLAWNGAFAFYIPGVVLIAWVIATTVLLVKSIRIEESNLAPAGATRA